MIGTLKRSRTSNGYRIGTGADDFYRVQIARGKVPVYGYHVNNYSRIKCDLMGFRPLSEHERTQIEDLFRPYKSVRPDTGPYIYCDVPRADADRIASRLCSIVRGITPLYTL